MAKEAEFMKSLKAKEQKLIRLQKIKLDKTMHIMEQNQYKEAVKQSKDSRELEEDKAIETKLESMRRSIDDHIRKKNMKLNKMAYRNSDHMDLVKQRLRSLETEEDKRYMENVVKLVEDHK